MSDMQDGASPREDIDLALWVATNRPIRPAGWANMSEQSGDLDVLNCSDLDDTISCNTATLQLA